MPTVFVENELIFFDVGANEGEYSIAASKAFPNATVYAFEPHPLTFARAKRKVEERAQLNNLALGSAVGQVTLYDRTDIEGSAHASLYGDVITELHQRDSVAVKVQMTTIDDFTATNAIDHIDFLKIDTEGHEFEVLRGATTLLKAGKIRYVQFEFNEMDVISRVFLRDIRVLLDGHHLFRILPNSLLPIDIAPLTAEVFAFQNILAVPNNELVKCGLAEQ